MTVERELRQFFGRLVISGPDRVCWDGVELPAPNLIETIHGLLYASYYSRGPAMTPGSWPMTPPPLDPRQSLAPAVERANAGRDRWDGGWRIIERRHDGAVKVQKGERTRWAPAGAHQRESSLDDGRVRVWAPRGRPANGGGFCFVFGEELRGEADEAATLRFYFNVPVAVAPDLIEVLSRGLNHYQVPFQLKVLEHPDLYPRADAAVLYVSRSSFAIVAQVLEFAPRSLLERLEPEVPLFSRAHAPGIGLADDTGSQESFGSLRCRLVSEAIVELASRGLQDEEHRLSCTRQRFAAAGLDFDRPHLAPGFVDHFHGPGVGSVDAGVASGGPT